MRMIPVSCGSSISVRLNLPVTHGNGLLLRRTSDLLPQIRTLCFPFLRTGNCGTSPDICPIQQRAHLSRLSLLSTDEAMHLLRTLSLAADLSSWRRFHCLNYGVVDPTEAFYHQGLLEYLIVMRV